jgi:hypothetical protein
MRPEVKMQRLLPILSLAAIACSGGDKLPPEAEAAVQAVNDAFAATLVAADSARNVAAQARRNVPCPAITKEGSVNDFIVTADYGDGCVPDSELVPVEVGGVVSVAYADQTLTVSYDDYTIDGESVDGSTTGSYEGLIGGLTLTLDSALDFQVDDFPERVESDLVVEIGAVRIEIDGSALETYANGDEYSLAITDVIIEYDNLLFCPMPSSGSVVADLDGFETSLVFLGPGEVEVTWGSATYETDLCEYASTLY